MMAENAEYRTTFMVSGVSDKELQDALGDDAQITMITVGDNGICAWEANVPDVLRAIARHLPEADARRVKSAGDLSRPEKDALLSIFAAGNPAWGTSPSHLWDVSTPDHPMDVPLMMEETGMDSIVLRPEVSE